MKLAWAALLAATIVGAAEDPRDRLWHLRNLGKAFYENAATQYEAVDVFRQALELAPDSARERLNYGLALLRAGKTAEGVAELEKAQKQDPSIPHTWFNLGITYKRESQYDRALEQLEGMVALVPDEAITHYNLGVLYKLEKNLEKSVYHFERAAAIDRNLAGPHFQLSTTYRQLKKPDEAKRQMKEFRRIKKEQEGAAVPEDLEWSYYSEIYDAVYEGDDRHAAPRQMLRLKVEKLADLKGKDGGVAVLDVDGDGRPELLAWSAKAARLFAFDEDRAEGRDLPFDGAQGVYVSDFNNDALPDLCVLTAKGAALYVNEAGSFKPFDAALPKGPYDGAVWLDFDHDYDDDLFLLGKASRLMRNNGAAGFADHSAAFPFVEGHALSGTRVDLIADTQGMDLAVSYADRPGVVYRDYLAGKYEAHPLEALPAGARVRAYDVDNDGWTDLVAQGKSPVLLRNAQRYALEALPLAGRGPLLVADLHNRGSVDLVTAEGIYAHLGGGRFDGEAEKLPVKRPVGLEAADFDGDGRLDLAAADKDGRVHLLFNRTPTDNRWVRVGLTGVKNLKLAPGAEVEVKAGRGYQKKIYRGMPLHFGLGLYPEVDAVRITWPNGLIQNETRQGADSTYTYEEAQRLSGSCPMVFTWNGTEFEFIADVLGVAPLGASAGDGQYFPVDHDEYIQVAAEQLRPVDGRYQVRVTEELREIGYIDAIELVAVDHPASVEVFTNDKFKGPPFPEFRLFGVEERLYPVAARDQRGQDVLKRVTARDQRYADGFERDYESVAEMHHIELDFGGALADNEGVLVLSGWVDWADGSTFRGVGQEREGGLVFPYLQVRDPEGRWQTVIADMGLPAGKPKTIVVDMSGKFLTDDRQVRIVTNLCLYWDEIFAAEAAVPPPNVLTRLTAAEAELRFRGFSGVVVHPQRLQPEHFVYAERRDLSMWNPTPGRYTRFGDVRPLLAKIDDLMVVFGAGDELRLEFDATALPPLAEGWRRDFLLYFDGWAKDGDANTAFSQSVEPLPYHGMPQYPYPEPHRFPRTPEHRRYLEHYQTREALRLIRPLNEGLVDWRR